MKNGVCILFKYLINEEKLTSFSFSWAVCVCVCVRYACAEQNVSR